MNERTTSDPTRELISEAALSKNLDKSLLNRLSGLLDDLERSCSAEDDSFRESILRCRSLLSGIVEGKSDDVNADVAQITRALNMMHKSVHQGAISRPGGDGEPSCQSSKGRFELPRDIEEKVFSRAVASLRQVLAEIEEDLVDEVVVDFLERDRSSAEEEDLRRRFSVIRRNSRLLRLLDIERVCLASEEYIQKMIPGVERASRLLEVKDWIANALNSYSELKFPCDPYTKVIACLDASIMKKSGMDMDDEA
jgi:hypothetical protein